MANRLYNTGRNAFLNAAVNWGSDTIKAALVSGYTADTVNHQFLSDVTGAGGGTIAASAALASKSSTAGVADAANVTFSAVASGPSCADIIIYKDTGTPTTSQLIAVIDTATGLPVTPVGVDITVSWDTGA